MQEISRNTIRINCTTIDTANQFKVDLVDFIQSQFYPKLEVLLDEYDTTAKTWEIDRVQIAFEIKNIKQWKNEFLHEALAQIRLFLRQEFNNDYSQKEVPLENINFVIDFLKTGNLKNVQEREKFHQILIDINWTSQNKAQLLKSISSDVQAILRFVFSMPHAIKKKIMGAKKLEFHQNDEPSKHSVLSGKRFSSEFKDFLEIIYRAESLPNSLQGNFTQLLTTHFEVAKPEFQDWLDIQSETVQIKFQDLKALLKGKTDPPEIFEEGDAFSEVEYDDLAPGSIDSQDIYYINNGGLILLHPFLQNLFKKLGYLKDDQSGFKSKQLQNRAVLITQYLINFEERIFENDLVFNKILCGVKITDAINTKVDFSDREIELCQDLLISTISHWKILKNTSPEGLQSSFLQRNAKLKKDENTWKLTVEKQGIDVLLNHLPWGIGTVKIPWMNNYLTCDWSL